VSLRRAILYSALALTGAVVLLVTFCPPPSLYGDFHFSSAVEDRNGKLLRLALANDERYRLKVPLEDIAQSAIDATLLYEDRHFFRHPGVNPGALIRAAWSTYVQRKRVMGGSTITMQLARLRYSLDSRSIGGKMVQIARAVQLERHYSKDEILEAYLNLAPYGGNIEGIGTAALIYFDKPASGLSLPESLALAVVSQNPVRRNPGSVHGYAEMRQARARLVDRWADEFGLSDAAISQLELPLAIRPATELPYIAPHFSRNVLAKDGRQSGIHRATLDLVLQATLENHIDNYTDRHRSIGIENATAMLIDYGKMEILASVGSSDFFSDGIQGRVDGTRAKRSPGSTLKPFVYGLAIDYGVIHPMTLLKDAPKRFAAYTPENFDRGFMGPIVARDALVYSRNVPAIELLARVGHDNFHDFLIEGDVAGLRNPEFYGLAMILGGNELTMQELAGLYAMLANGGVARPLVTVKGDDSSQSVKRLLSPEASYLVLDMLRANPRPDAIGIGAARPRVPIAWKTGTSYAYRDAWTVGVFGPYVLAVWVGNFDGSSNPAFVGRQAAAPLFFAIADSLEANLPDRFLKTEPLPELNLRKVEVCASTGDLPGRHCPHTMKSWFVPGVSPIKVSDVHRTIRVDNLTGERTCNYDPVTTHKEVFEFWPSDISRVFRKAGIAIRRPPAWAAGCSLDLQAANGLAPQITSPAARLTYHVRPDRIEEERLPLTATTDGDVEWLYWFANDSFIAKVRRDEPVFWQPGPGDYDILAVDDLGRSNSRKLFIMAAQ
jgi:penicillin-binding protein 1C